MNSIIGSSVGGGASSKGEVDKKSTGSFNGGGAIIASVHSSYPSSIGSSGNIAGSFDKNSKLRYHNRQGSAKGGSGNDLSGRMKIVTAMNSDVTAVSSSGAP